VPRARKWKPDGLTPDIDSVRSAKVPGRGGQDLPPCRKRLETPGVEKSATWSAPKRTQRGSETVITGEEQNIDNVLAKLTTRDLKRMEKKVETE